MKASGRSSSSLTMILKNFILLLGLSKAIHITSNTNDTDAVVDTTDLIVDSGSYFSMKDNFLTTVQPGIVLINGAWHMVCTEEQTTRVRCLVKSFENNGLFQFNVLEGGDSSFYLSTGDFENHGDMYFGLNEQTDPVVEIRSQGKFVNEGMMVFRKDAGYNREVRLENDIGDVLNSGSICLHNTNFTQRANIIGDGCIHLEVSSNFEMDVSPENRLGFDKNQVIYMEENTIITCKGLLKGTSDVVVTVKAFGLGKFIFVDFPIFTFIYDGKTGTLTICDDNHLGIHFIIGQGYKTYYFKYGFKRRCLGYALRVQTENKCRCESTFPEPHSLLPK